MLKNPVMVPSKILGIKGIFQDMMTGQQNMYYFESSDEINHANTELMDNPLKSYTVQSVRVPFGYEYCEGWEGLTLGAIHKRATIHVDIFTSFMSFFLAVQQLERSSLQVNWYRAYLFKNPVNQDAIWADAQPYYNIRIIILNESGDQVGIVYNVYFPKSKFEDLKWTEEQILNHFIDRFAQMYSPCLDEKEEPKKQPKSAKVTDDLLNIMEENGECIGGMLMHCPPDLTRPQNEEKENTCTCGHKHDKEKIKPEKEMVTKNYSQESPSNKDILTH